ncbi:MAG: hypothetical protein ACOY90_08865 [Candidatus Zhuqueibacterota bacterium]
MAKYIVEDVIYSSKMRIARMHLQHWAHGPELLNLAGKVIWIPAPET